MKWIEKIRQLRNTEDIFEIEKRVADEEAEKICTEDEEKAKKLGIALETVRFLPDAVYTEPSVYPSVSPPLEYRWRSDKEGNLYRINMRIVKIVEFHSVAEQRERPDSHLFVMGDKLYAEKEGLLEEVVLKEE